MSNIRFVPNQAGIHTLFFSPDGPVVTDLMRRGQIVQDGGKAQVRRGHVHAGLQDVKGKSTPSLVDTIVKRMDLSRASGPCVIIGSDAPHAIIVHNGSRAHTILPRHGSVLVFYSARGGMVFAKKVNHPGTKANKYLTDQLAKAMA